MEGLEGVESMSKPESNKADQAASAKPVENISAFLKAGREFN